MRDVFLPAVCSAGMSYVYKRENPCKGAELNSSRCENAKHFIYVVLGKR